MYFSLLGLAGISIFSGISAHISTLWRDINGVARVISTLGNGIVLYAIGIKFLRESRKMSIIEPIIFVAILLKTIGLFILIDEFSNLYTSNWRLVGLIVFGAMLMQQLSIFIATKITILLFAVICFAGSFLFIVFDMIGITREWNLLIIGISLIFTVYMLRTQLHNNMIFILNAMGALCFLWGVFGILKNLI
ncbi:MAG: hypothetical protein R3D71_05090 [Rickettsiales bacterium]